MKGFTLSQKNPKSFPNKRPLTTSATPPPPPHASVLPSQHYCLSSGSAEGVLCHHMETSCFHMVTSRLEGKSLSPSHTLIFHPNWGKWTPEWLLCLMFSEQMCPAVAPGKRTADKPLRMQCWGSRVFVSHGSSLINLLSGQKWLRAKQRWVRPRLIKAWQCLIKCSCCRLELGHCHLTPLQPAQ